MVDAAGAEGRRAGPAIRAEVGLGAAKEKAAKGVMMYGPKTGSSPLFTGAAVAVVCGSVRMVVPAESPLGRL